MAVAFFMAPVQAQTPAKGFSGIGGDNAKKPIDIESDRLEVDDKKHTAVFIGNVSATQGDYNLKAPRLEVTYEKAQPAAAQDQSSARTAKPQKTPAADTSTDPMSSGQIRFIHATGGKVVVVSKTDEQQVTGDDAIYDVKGQKITMTGKEVILTQRQNVIKGKQLDIDLATGRATVIPEKGRVQAVFTQEAAKGIMSINPLTGAKKKDADSVEEAPKQPQMGANGQPQTH